MRRSFVLVFISLIALSLVMFSCKKTEKTVENLVEERIKRLKEYANFDKAYIPALFLTNEGEVEKSQKAMVRLKKVWKPYIDKYYPMVPKDPEFRESMDKIQNAIRKADQIVSSGEKLSEAHKTLEEIRYVFMNLRKGRMPKKVGVSDKAEWTDLPDYYIDYLNEFHEPMETIILIVKDKTPETLTDEDVSKIKENYGEASKLMVQIENAKFEPSIFDFSEEETQTLNGYIHQERQSLQKLDEALKSEDREKIIKASAGIKQAFLKMFTMFGDYENLQ